MLRRLLRLPPARFVLSVAGLYNRVGLPRSAAALAYFLILTLFPLLLWVNWFVGRFRFSLAPALEALARFLPAGVLPLLEDYLRAAAALDSPALLPLSLFTLLLSASAGLRTLLHTLEQLFDAAPAPPLTHLLRSLALSLLLLGSIYLSAAAVFTGDWFFGLLERKLTVPIPSGLGALWRRLRYLLLFAAFLLLVLAVYRLGIPRSRATDGRVLAAALFTALTMAGCSALFSWFLGLSTRYALVYGSLASLVLLLVWLYLCGLILLLGAAALRALSPP